MNQREIEAQLKRIQKKKRKAYFLFRLKSTLGFNTKGINGNKSLVLLMILEEQKVDSKIVVCRADIPETSEDLYNLHSSILRLNDNEYISIILDEKKRTGEIVILEKEKFGLENDFEQVLIEEFKMKLKKGFFLNAVDDTVKKLMMKIKATQ